MHGAARAALAGLPLLRHPGRSPGGRPAGAIGSDLDAALTAEAAAVPQQQRRRTNPSPAARPLPERVLPKPTRGFEPRTPSLRVKCSTS